MIALPDDPAVLNLVTRLAHEIDTRIRGAASPAGILRRAHTVLESALVPAARAVEQQPAPPRWRRTRQLGPTGSPLPWGHWSADITYDDLATLRAASTSLASSADDTDHATAAALDQLITLAGNSPTSLEVVDTVLALARPEHN